MNPETETGSTATDFGIFYPLGFIVAAFGRREDAQRVQTELLQGGYVPGDCVMELAATVASATDQNLQNNTGWLARLGKSDEAVQLQLDAARKGSTFLRIFAPNDLDAERAMNVVRRVSFDLAHRYQRFSIEQMK